MQEEASTCDVRVLSARSSTATGVYSTDEDDTLDTSEVLSISAITPSGHRRSDKWISPLLVEEHKIDFRIDSGAKCNVMVWPTYRRRHNLKPLEKSTKVLYSYSTIKFRQRALQN
jgi:hypothetical protein